MYNLNRIVSITAYDQDGPCRHANVLEIDGTRRQESVTAYMPDADIAIFFYCSYFLQYVYKKSI